MCPWYARMQNQKRLHLIDGSPVKFVQSKSKDIVVYYVQETITSQLRQLLIVHFQNNLSKKYFLGLNGSWTTFTEQSSGH